MILALARDLIIYSFMVLAKRLSVITIINYDHKTFIVHATGFAYFTLFDYSLIVISHLEDLMTFCRQMLLEITTIE
jgi:hypothetical protein